MLKLPLQELIETLERLGFTKNEAKVYLTLVMTRNPLNASEISRRSGVPRANVYETLNKLVGRGFVLREAAGRGARYVAASPDQIFEALREEHKRYIELVEEARKTFDQLMSKVTRPFPGEAAWLVSGENRIDNILKDILNASTERFTALITPDVITRNGDTLLSMLKKKAEDGVEVLISLKITSDILDKIKELAKSISVFHWQLGEIPMGCYVSDGTRCLMTLVGKWAPILTYDIGIWTENPVYAKSFEYLTEKLLTLNVPFKKYLEEEEKG